MPETDRSGLLRLGFTGTRNEPTDQQLDWLWREMVAYRELHHGACVGADSAAHQAATDCGVPIIVHPPENIRLRMDYDPRATWLPAKPYLVRNRDIVNATDELIAVPDGPERQQSGTWSTIRYAVNLGRLVTICYPDGRIESRHK
jgi:predicted Rossmann fold nucleotide-binding protein DprA/Smf involved in DNA uptake